MPTNNSLRLTIQGALLTLVLLAWGEGAMAQPAAEKPAQENKALTAALTGILEKQTLAWNEGDIDGFLKPYWNDENLTFSSGGNTARGWKATKARYQKGYPDKATMGKLTFSELEVYPLSEGAAFMLGRWKLDRESPAEGNFSLVWKKIDGQWLIVHDHSSQTTPAEKKAAESKEK